MRWFLNVALLVFAGAPLAAQARQNPERLREQIVTRFMQSYRTQSGLTAEQFEQFQEVARQSWQERRRLEASERQLVQALEQQMRPGVVANSDSVTALLESMLLLGEERVAHARADQEVYAGFLTPVQRAQLVLAWARLERQIETIIRRRAEGRRQE